MSKRTFQNNKKVNKKTTSQLIIVALIFFSIIIAVKFLWPLSRQHNAIELTDDNQESTELIKTLKESLVLVRDFDFNRSVENDIAKPLKVKVPEESPTTTAMPELVETYSYFNQDAGFRLELPMTWRAELTASKEIVFKKEADTFKISKIENFLTADENAWKMLGTSTISNQEFTFYSNVDKSTIRATLPVPPYLYQFEYSSEYNRDYNSIISSFKTL